MRSVTMTTWLPGECTILNYGGNMVNTLPLSRLMYDTSLARIASCESVADGQFLSTSVVRIWHLNSQLTSSHNDENCVNSKHRWVTIPAKTLYIRYEKKRRQWLLNTFTERGTNNERPPPGHAHLKSSACSLSLIHKHTNPYSKGEVSILKGNWYKTLSEHSHRGALFSGSCVAQRGQSIFFPEEFLNSLF